MSGRNTLKKQNDMFVSNYQRNIDRMALEINSADERGMTWAKAYAMARLRLRVKKEKMEQLAP